LRGASNCWIEVGTLLLAKLLFVAGGKVGGLSEALGDRWLMIAGGAGLVADGAF